VRTFAGSDVTDAAAMLSIRTAGISSSTGSLPIAMRSTVYDVLLERRGLKEVPRQAGDEA
jgi:hypothetical protein